MITRSAGFGGGGGDENILKLMVIQICKYVTNGILSVDELGTTLPGFRSCHRPHG